MSHFFKLGGFKYTQAHLHLTHMHNFNLVVCIDIRQSAKLYFPPNFSAIWYAPLSQQVAVQYQSQSKTVTRPNKSHMVRYMMFQPRSSSEYAKRVSCIQPFYSKKYVDKHPAGNRHPVQLG